MIGFLRGEILDVCESRATVLVGGVGYQVALVRSGEFGTLAVGSKVDLHIHTHVREDALDLYGFFSRHDKELFLLLLGVNGIGPKGALSILSGMSTGSLVDAILSEDHGSLQKIPGVGKKTAERVVLELADVLKKRTELAALASKAPGGTAAPKRMIVSGAADFSLRAFVDARDALVGLGFREADVATVLKRIETDAAQGSEWKPEILVKQALQLLR